MPVRGSIIAEQGRTQLFSGLPFPVNHSGIIYDVIQIITYFRVHSYVKAQYGESLAKSQYQLVYDIYEIISDHYATTILRNHIWSLHDYYKNIVCCVCVRGVGGGGVKLRT